MQTILIAAITLNNKIAKHTLHNANWTSQADKAFFKKETKKAGAVIFGETTYQVMHGIMPGVLNLIMTFEPKKYKDRAKKNILEFTKSSPEEILENLKIRDYKKVVIAGGQSIYSLFLEKNLVDYIYLTVAPKIFGKGLQLFKEMSFDEMDLEFLSVKELEKGEIVLKYKVQD